MDRMQDYANLDLAYPRVVDRLVSPRDSVRQVIVVVCLSLVIQPIKYRHDVVH